MVAASKKTAHELQRRGGLIRTAQKNSGGLGQPNRGQ